MEETVLIYLEKDNKYLMMYRNKKQHDPNFGKYIGVGGRIEEDETKGQALVREVREETSLILKSYIYILFTSVFNSYLSFMQVHS